MRFTNETGLMQVLKYSSQRLTRILTVPLTNGYRKLRRVLNPNGFTTRVMADVRKGGKDLITGRPQSLKDYFSMGNYYVAKKLVFLIAVLVLVLPILYLKFLHPVIRSNFLTVSMVVNSGEMVGYTGKVELLSAKGGTVLYRGPLSEGRITGEGALYDYEGNLTYQGGFLLEQYEGSGQSFWPNGQVQYTGSFSKNAYEGEGTLYGEDGTLIYQGSFSKGLYEGDGVLYQNGEVLYRGAFRGGQMEGEGRIYAGDLVIYEGGFAAGAFEGTGREYDPVEGRLIYDGEYAAGKYQGQGRKFDADTGQLVYEGGFYQGVYEGEGKLYDPVTQVLLYEGGFRAGRYDGEGVEYDPETGAVIYRGEFLLGAYHGAGTQYDPATGFVTAAGQYRDGVLVTGEQSAASSGQGGQTTPGDGGQTTPGTEDGQTAPGEDGQTTPGDQDGQSGQTTPGGQDGQTSPGEDGGETTPGGSQVYQGPVTEEGTIDYSALADMTAQQAGGQFAARPDEWSVADGGVLVYADQTEGIGLSIRTDSGGSTVSVDVWNDAPVAGGAQVGMTQAQLAAVLGSPTGSAQETMGAGRLISISQSNRYFGRLTNLSPESKVTVYTYSTGSGTVRAVFAAGTEECLLLEVLP